jgi:L-rhamnose mutarotase
MNADQTGGGSHQRPDSVTRHGQVLRLREGCLDTYREYHDRIWPAVAETIAECNIRNYTIFHRAGWLFAYFEYHGSDLEADMARMAADPTTQKWWEIMEPMQSPVEFATDGEWWCNLTEVFHLA